MDNERNISAESQNDDLYSIIKRECLSDDPAEDIQIDLIPRGAVYFNRNKEEEKSLLAEAEQIAKSILSICKKIRESSFLEARSFDLLFSKEELKIYDRWLAPLRVPKENSPSPELIEKSENINHVRYLKWAKKRRRLKRDERAFLAEHEKDELSEVELKFLSENKRAIAAAQKKRIGASAYSDNLMWYTQRSYKNLTRLSSPSEESRFSTVFINRFLLHRLDMMGKIRTDANDPTNYSITGAHRRNRTTSE